MRLRLAVVVMMCALVPLVLGCASWRGSTATEPETGADIATGIPLAPDFRIADIPVPAGFEFDRKTSFVFQNNNIDVGRIVYAGKEQIGDVAQFYIDEMPRYNWKLLNVAEHQTVTLDFDKENKACQVLLTPKAPRGTLIQVLFYPKAAQ
ncbi:MAG: hypothetical protein C4532_19260 [Candidatus Abyssobacteria bacterium SURF_17]|uniref:Lipoprotein n=1 Tax=Candidatus Abyssobacteria bacterium SURF_17 TaxID=2093361 RepID=A0A419ENT5_9BACT|nr:MAG: hypothetical protein C4532_19260 [Candidatus Abyssubacteria bacterium SURF_17]